MGCHPNIGLPLERCLKHCAGKRRQQGRGGQKSMRVCGSHCGILQSLQQFGEPHLYPEESGIPWRTAAEPCAYCQLDRSLLMGWGRAGSAGDVWSLQGGTKSVCSVMSLQWKSLRRVPGLALGGVRVNGQHLDKADHLNHALCTFLVSSVETRWEKYLWNVAYFSVSLHLICLQWCVNVP